MFFIQKKTFVSLSRGAHEQTLLPPPQPNPLMIETAWSAGSPRERLH